MFHYIKLLCFVALLFTNNYLYSAEINKTEELSKMSCYDLMVSLVFGSSYGVTMEKLDLSFSFERTNDKYMMLTLVQKIEENRMAVRGNLELDLVNKTLNNIDGETPKPIKINTKYIPYISQTCTKENNVYVNIGRLPDINGN
ncbi:hypothetical protein J2N86_13770 [Legionella lytica]|uniref:VirK protein n=1 Tax=Legionella lytica TaxID=96232 RepID=A0ABY4Y7V4_9GAMM|nr:hypothetical protein [Legionella lytica]USQ13723.1 hypothetical protein J2N86_13770 [Legionella lytica]